MRRALELAAGICFGLFGFTVLLAACYYAYLWDEQRRVKEFVQSAQVESEAELQRLRLKPGQRCEAGTVLIVEGRTAVQLLENGGTVPCAGDYRLREVQGRSERRM